VVACSRACSRVHAHTVSGTGRDDEVRPARRAWGAGTDSYGAGWRAGRVALCGAGAASVAARGARAGCTLYLHPLHPAQAARGARWQPAKAREQAREGRAANIKVYFIFEGA
jgi:hypothetical protein